MSGLYFFGVKKSTIKKLPPFKYLFDWRDRNIYENVLSAVKKNYEVIESGDEKMVTYPLNNKIIKATFRKFPSSDLAVFNQVFLHKCYHPIVQKLLEYTDSSSPVKMIDAGANVGYACLYFKTFFPQADIVAIEPDENNSRQLEKNLSANQYSLVELIKGGLWHRASWLEVVRDFRDNREAAFTVKEISVNTNIRGYGFLEILERQRWEEVDLVKIDIEGSERFLFNTVEKADAILSRTKFLAIEIHDEFNIRHVIYEHLKRNGFDYFEFDDLTLAINHKKIKG